MLISKLFKKGVKFSKKNQTRAEVIGLLIPIFYEQNGRLYRFKVVSDRSEYLLEFAESNLPKEKRLNWNEVYVSGFIDASQKVLRVEQLFKLTSNETTENGMLYTDPVDELNSIQQSIRRNGKIEHSSDHLAS